MSVEPTPMLRPPVAAPDVAGRRGAPDERASGARPGSGGRPVAGTPSDRGAGLSSVRNASRLLCAYTQGDRDLGVSELAARLGLAKSTVHRLLATLALDGLVERDEATGRYRLGLRLYELGAMVSSHLDLHEVVTEPLDDLRNRTHETVHVSILDGGEVVYIERRESPQTVRVFGRVGHRNHAHCTSSGKVLLAWLAPDDRAAIVRERGLVAHTPRTITDPDRLEAELAVVRERGWSTNLEESELGVSSVAAPIRDASGAVAAAIACAAPSTRLTRETMRRYAAETIGAAERISERLGYRGEPAGLRQLGGSGRNRANSR
jgi:IclR family transcriptional regulator, KDG regulon repressor